MGIISKTAKRIFYTKKEKRHELVGPPKLWKMKQEFQINFLKSKGLSKEHNLLDIGCGTLRGGIPLIDYLDNGNYTGIDIRSEAIKEAFKELKEEGLENKNPIVKQFDSFQELKLENQYIYMFAFSVLIHMEDSICKSCIQFASENLKEDGVFFANVNYGERKDGNWQGYPIAFRSFKFYQELATVFQLKVEEIGTLLELGHDSGSELGDSQVMLKFYK